MKKVVWTLAMLVLTGGMASAQDTNELVPTAPVLYETAQTHSALDRAIIANENKIVDAIMKKDKVTLKSLIAADGGVSGSEGFATHADFLASIDQLTIKSFKISDEKVVWVDPNTAVLTYKFTGSATHNGQPLPASTYSSTVWTKRGDKWVAVFHQESEAAKPAVPKK
jgi:hypothetical protein